MNLPSLLLHVSEFSATGALVGWFAFRIPVWLLFHPQKEWRIGGWRVPLTPGLLAGERTQLAAAASTAAAHAMPDAARLREILHGLNLRQPIGALLKSQRAALAAEHRTIAEKIGRREELLQLEKKIATSAADRAASLASDFVSREDRILTLVRGALTDLLSQPLATHFTPARRTALRDGIIDQLKSLVKKQETDDFVRGGIATTARGFTGSYAFTVVRKASGDFLAERAPNAAFTFQEGLAQYVASDAFAAIVQPIITSKLYDMIVGRFGMAKMFISENRIFEMISQRWDDLIAEAQKLILGDSVHDFLTEQITTAGQNLFKSLQFKLEDPKASAKTIDWLATRAIANAAAFLEREQTVTALDKILANFLAKSPRALYSEIDKLVEQAALRAFRSGADWIASPDGRAWITGHATAAVHPLLFEVPLSKAATMISESNWNSASDWLAANADDRALEIIPNMIVSRVNPSEIAASKIRALDPDRIKTFLKTYGAKPLRAISLAGAAFGLIAGGALGALFYFLNP